MAPVTAEHDDGKAPAACGIRQSRVQIGARIGGGRIKRWLSSLHRCGQCGTARCGQCQQQRRRQSAEHQPRPTTLSGKSCPNTRW